MFVAIVDDDKNFLHILQEELQTLFNDCQIDCYDNINDDLYKKQYDILFLDVMLYDNKSFDLGQKVNSLYPKTILVYISSIEHFVYESYRQNTFFFVRKSCLYDDLLELKKKYNNLKRKENEILVITVHKNIIELLQCDILYIQSRRNQLTVKTLSNEYTTYISLKRTLEVLNKTNFHQFNSYTIINLEHILKVEKNYLVMINKKEIPFTRNSKDKFMKAYMEFRRRQLWNG